MSHYGMYYEDNSAHDLIEGFLGEMDRGLAGQGSSLKMIPTYLTDGREIAAEKP